MKNLIRFEFRKLVRQKSMWVCSAVLIAMLIISILSLRTQWQNLSEFTEEEGIFFALPTTGEFTVSALNTCSFTLILGVFSAMYMREDHSEGIIKNIYSKGYSRTNVFLSKLAAVATYCVLMAIVCISFSYIGSIIVLPAEQWSDPSSILKPIGVQLILLLAYTSMYATISSLVKKSSSSIALCIIAPTVVSLALGLADTIIYSYKSSEDFLLSKYWLDYMFSGVSHLQKDKDILLLSTVGGIIYTAVFTVLGIATNKRTQV